MTKIKKEDKVTDAMLQLVEAVKENTVLLHSLFKSVTPVATVKELHKGVVDETPATVSDSKIPVPLEYRHVVDAGLNKSFGIEIEPLFDRPSFTLVIVTPEKYSNLSEEYKKLYKRDLRPKILNYADGINGVRQWAEQVFNSFNQDIRSMIVADRVQGH